MNDFRSLLPIFIRKTAFGLLVFLVVSSVTFSVTARDMDRQSISKVYFVASQGARVTMGDAMNMVQQRTGGRVVSAQNIKQDGREAYRIKVLTRSGEIQIFVVDAQSGSVHRD